MKILVLTKRRASGKDLLEDRFGRAYEMARGLANLGHEVSVIAVGYRREQPWAGEIAFDDNTTIQVTALTIDWPFPWRSYRAIRKKIKETGPDIVWCSGDALQVILGVRLARQIGIAVVADLYDNYEAFWPTRLPLVYGAFRRAVGHADGITCVSGPLASMVQDRYKPIHKPAVLENGVDPTLFRDLPWHEARQRLDLPPDAILIGTAGSLRTESGITTLIEAFRLIKTDFPRASLVLAGSTNDRRFPGNDNDVRFLGYLPHGLMPAFLRSLDLAVISNRNNSFGKYCYPLKLPEIGAAQIPFVVPRLPAMEELFRKHQNIFYEPGSAASLARAMRRQLRYPDSGFYRPTTWQEIAQELDIQLSSIVAGPRKS